MSFQPFITAKAPSNIALIKYMGKSDPKLNLPCHGSLSMTLNQLCTIMQFEVVEGKGPLKFSYVTEVTQDPTRRVPDLDERAVTKMHTHFERVAKWSQEKNLFNTQLSQVKWRTWNTFPAGTGIASSASSFAAATLGFLAATSKSTAEIKNEFQSAEWREGLTALARQGSGSSCRSLDGPFVFWEHETATAMDSKLPKLTDLVCLVSSKAKSVSSSEAHLRVKASPLWEGRVERVERRLTTMKSALWDGDLSKVAALAWQEAWEMHSLFHTSQPPFTYFESMTLEILKYLETTQNGSEPPVVTLDAGPNVHVLVPTAKAKQWKAELKKAFPTIEILEDEQGTGAQFEVHS